MFEKFALNFAISFILRQIAKFGSAVDWDKVKVDCEARVAALVPGTWFDDEAKVAVDYVLDAAKVALSQEDAIKAILQALAFSPDQALEAAKKYLLAVWQQLPKTASQEKTVANVLALDWKNA